MISLRRPIVRFAKAMGSTTFYAATMVALAVSVAVVVVMGQSSPIAIGIILAMSAFSIIQGSTILVEQRQSSEVARQRDEAMHAKLDSLLHGVKDADDALIGIEQKIVEDE